MSSQMHYNRKAKQNHRLLSNVFDEAAASENKRQFERKRLPLDEHSLTLLQRLARGQQWLLTKNLYRRLT